MATVKDITFQAMQDPFSLQKVLLAIKEELAQLATLLNESKTDLTAHTHGTVTAAPTISADSATAHLIGAL